MKTYIIAAFFITFSTLAQADEQPAAKELITAGLSPVCGLSDTVYAKLPEWLGGNKSTFQIALPGKQGESGRRLYIFADSSWLLTLEFLGFNAEDDMSCVVAMGGAATAEHATKTIIEFLPDEWFGPNPKKMNAVTKILRKPARRIDIYRIESDLTPNKRRDR